MADDPYAKYMTPPATPSTSPTPGSAADPYSKYLTQPGTTPAAPAAQTQPTPLPAATPVADQTGGAYTYMDVNPNAGLGERMLAHIHNAAVASNNWERTFGNAMTMNWADKLQGMLPGQDVNQLRAQSKASREDLGPVGALTAEAAGYGMGPGKILGPLAGKLLGGGVMSAAAEGAGAGALSAAGSDSDIATGAAVGAGTGAGAGFVGKYIVNPLTRLGLSKIYNPATQEAANVAATQANVNANPLSPVAGQQQDAAAAMQKMGQDLRFGNISPASSLYDLRANYTEGSPEWNMLSKLYKATGDKGLSPRTITGLASPLVEAGVAAVSPPAAFLAGGLEHLAYPAVGNVLNYIKGQKLQNMIGAAWPEMTGQPVTRGKFTITPALQALGLGRESASGL